MPQRKRILTLFLWLIAIGVLITAGWWIYRGQSGSGIVRLADGREITIKRITYGKSHRYISGNPLGKTLVYLGATNLAAQFGSKTFQSRPVSRGSPDSDFLMAWIEMRGTNLPVNAVVPAVATILDLAGHESARNFFTTAAAFPGGVLYGFPIRNFPRRDQMFVVRFSQLEKADYLPIAEFKTRNPARGPFPVWTPEPLPIERRAGEEVVTLSEFNTGLSATGLVKQQTSAAWTEFLFRVGTNEPAYHGTNARQHGEWYVAHLELTDATGNFIQNNEPRGRIVWQTATQYVSKKDDGVVNLADFLWTNELAWKIRAEFERTTPAATELWEVKGLALPTPGTYRELNIRTQLHNIPVMLKGIAAPGASFPGEASTKAKDRPRIHLEFDPPTNLFEFTLDRVVDQRGRIVRKNTVAWSPGRCAFSLQSSPETTALDFTFALRRNYVLEFVAKPSLLATNVAHWGASTE